MTWKLKNKPYEVQSQALIAAGNQEGFAYLMEMGLGKSAVGLNEYLELRDACMVDHLIIHCPNSLKRNWKDEVVKWGANIDVYIWPQTPKFKKRGDVIDYKLDRPVAWVFNFESILFAGGEELENFLKANTCMWILDESSRIKNFNAKSTKAILALSPFAKVRRILTGTPMSQSVMDLWPQLRFIGELKGVNPYAFRNHFGIMGGYMNKKVIGVKNAVELESMLKKCAFQAKKKDWTDLPEKIYVNRHVEMTKPQQDAYNDMKRHFLLMIKEDVAITAPMVITQLNKLQQIARGFIYDEEREAQTLVEPSKNPCIDLVKEVLDEIEGKLVVMAQYRHSMSALFNSLYMYNAARLAGGMTEDEIDAEKKKFNDNPECRVIVVQIGVGGLGHTLLGSAAPNERCSTMMFYENTFSLEKRKQAEDRIHRYGQDKACLYIDIVASAMDKKLALTLQKKEDIVRMVMDGVKNNEF